jgi:hypothetical protein
MRVLHRLGSERMRSAWFFLLVALIVATPARAGGPYPAVPPEIGVAPFIGPTWDTYRCAYGTIHNFYHGAYYGEEPPALFAATPTGRITGTAPIADCRGPISA